MPVNHDALAMNLRTRLCRQAGTSSEYLTPDAAGFIERRLKKWLGSRKVGEKDIQKAAEDMKRRYPKAFPPAGVVIPKQTPSSTKPKAAAPSLKASHSSEVKHGTAGKVRPSDLKKRPATTEPTELPLRRSPPPVERSATSMSAGELTRDNLRRPQVIARMQRVLADKEWHSAAMEDARVHAEAKQRAMEQRMAQQVQVRSDMREAERYRNERHEAEKNEREENRRVVHRVMEEVKQHERDLQMQRRNKFLQEKQFIELQREQRRAELERREAEQKAENQRLRKFIEEDIKVYKQQEHDKAVAVRDSLLDFLSQSKEHLALKKKREQEQRMREREIDQRNAMIGGGTLDRGSLSEQRLRDHHQRKVQALSTVQDQAGEVYLEMKAQEQLKRKEEEERIKRELLKQEVAVEERARKDAEKAKKMRQQLVSSLDIEIDIHQQRKVQAETEKHQLRKQMDELAEKEAAMTAAEKKQAREYQHKLQKSIDEQLDARFDALLKPQKIKITEK